MQERVPKLILAVKDLSIYWHFQATVDLGDKLMNTCKYFILFQS